MTLRIPDAGEVAFLGTALGKTAVEALTLRLFTNNVTPGDGDTVATYTEATGSGYAAVAITAANWTLTAGAPSDATYPEVTFTFTGALGNVYGYYITGDTSSAVWWAEAFTGGPFDVQNNGDQIKVTPVITLKDTVD